MIVEKTTWRLVCHRCGKRWPIGQAIAVSKVECCDEPRIRIHDTVEECAWCSDKPILKAGDEVIGIVERWEPTKPRDDIPVVEFETIPVGKIAPFRIEGTVRFPRDDDEPL